MLSCSWEVYLFSRPGGAAGREISTSGFEGKREGKRREEEARPPAAVSSTAMRRANESRLLLLLLSTTSTTATCLLAEQAFVEVELLLPSVVANAAVAVAALAV